MKSNVLDWIEQSRYESNQTCSPISWAKMRLWDFAEGGIKHATRLFFSLNGYQVISNLPSLDGSEQPMIHQPEVGILGILLHQHKDENLILVQAKAEPGNVGVVQIAPTVQATESNYTQVHGGLPTLYLEYFLSGHGETISDSLQSEHGGRFLRKFNRNIIKQVNDSFPHPVNDFWRWIPLQTVLDHLLEDFMINTDERSVLASSDWHRLSGHGRPFLRGSGVDDFGIRIRQSFEVSVEQSSLRLFEVERSLKKWRKETKIILKPKPIKTLEGWSFDDRALVGEVQDGSFKPYRIKVASREVPEWDQPLFCANAKAEVLLLCQIRIGILCFLFRKRVEIGFQELVQLGPSVQLDGISSRTGHDSMEQWLLECAVSGRQQLTCLQSEEGGRFFQSLCEYSVIQLEDETKVPDHESLFWLNLSQIHELIKTKGTFTNETRNAISLLLYYL